MAEVAVSHVLSDEAAPNFTGADMSTKLKLMGVDVASLGDSHGRTEGSRSYVLKDELNQVYKKIVVNAEGDKIIGGVLVGDAAEYDNLLLMYREGLGA